MQTNWPVRMVASVIFVLATTLLLAKQRFRPLELVDPQADFHQSASSGSFCCFIEPKHHSAGAFFLTSSKPAGSSSLL
jgi:hypothetical protein